MDLVEKGDYRPVDLFILELPHCIALAGKAGGKICRLLPCADLNQIAVQRLGPCRSALVSGEKERADLRKKGPPQGFCLRIGKGL